MAEVKNTAAEAASENVRKKKQPQIVVVWNRLKRNRTALVGMTIFFAIILLAALGEWIAPYRYDAIDMRSKGLPPSWQHLFGTDSVGRDIFSRILVGARYSLTLGILSTLFGSACGIFLGCIAGYFGGTVDELIMRFCDIIQSIPGMILNVAVACAIGVGYWKTILVLGISGITAGSRMIRAQILKIRNMEYIEAATVTNCSNAKIIWKHLIPNSISASLVGMTMGIGGHIMSAAGLAYLGLGVQPPTPEWGAMLSDGRNYLRQYPWICIFPGVAIMITVLSLNLFGDGLRDALDPKLKK